MRLVILLVLATLPKIGDALKQRTNDKLLTGGSSYLSSHDKRVRFGLGKLSPKHSEDVEMVWGTQIASSLEINLYHRIVEQATK
jgi:hypothetical protein